MAWRDQQKRSARSPRPDTPRAQQGLLLCFPGHRGQHHRAAQALTPAPAQGQQIFAQHEIELQVAHHAHVTGPQGAQALGVGLGLCQHAMHGGQRRAHQALQPAPLGPAALAQARVGQHHGHTRTRSLSLQFRPDLGLHQHTQRRALAGEKAPHGTRCVNGQPGLAVTGLQQGAAGVPPGGRAVGQQQRHAGQALAQGGDQRSGSKGLAQRDRVHPEGSGRLVHTPTQAFTQVLPVARLPPAPPPQPRQPQRQGQAQQGGIDQPCHRMWRSVSAPPPAPPRPASPPSARP